MAKKRAFVTGGTGFTGYYIVKSLIENNIKVTALIRETSKTSSIDRLRSIGAELITGDIVKPESFSNALEGISYFFHCAAIHKVWTDDTKLLYKINVDATNSLLDVAVNKGVEQFIYTSSIKTVGLLKGRKISNEETEYNLFDLDGDYGKSKYIAEKLLLESNKDIIIKILNPSAIVGPGDYLLTPTMDLLHRFLEGSIRFTLDTCMGLVDVRDVGEAHFLALEKAKPKEKYILCAYNLTMNELFSRLGKLANTNTPKVRIPYWLAYPIAYLSTGISSFTKRPPIVSPRSLNMARLMPRYDGTKANKELGINYRSIDETLKDSVNWLKESVIK